MSPINRSVMVSVIYREGGREKGREREREGGRKGGRGEMVSNASCSFPFASIIPSCSFPFSSRVSLLLQALYPYTFQFFIKPFTLLVNKGFRAAQLLAKG